MASDQIISSPVSSSFLLVLSLLSITLRSLSTPTRVGYDCSDGFVPNSIYQANLNTLLRSLSSNATSKSFFTSSEGSSNSNDAVYGFFLCRGDQNATSCANCITTATTIDLPKTCLKSKGAIIWYDICMVRYSDEALAGKLSTNPGYRVSSSETPANQTGFNQVLMELMTEILSKAAGDEKKFATGVKSLEGSEKLYGLLQCMPDLTPNDCNLCLNAAISDLLIGIDGKCFEPSCFAQYATHKFFNGAPDFSPSPAHSTSPMTPPTGRKKSTKVIIATTVPIAIVFVIVLIMCIWLIKKQRKKYYDALSIETAYGLELVNSLHYDLKTLKLATNNFSVENKLGEGGFGEVFKGTLRDGQQIAVKRLSKSSGQGVREFTNEVLLVAKLQHKNLVQLLGFCTEGNEKLLVYEFVPNKSLNYFLFDPAKQWELDWNTRYKIIRGIAQGLLYLHQDSRLTIIHRDLKASNVLLDADMNPKISDFGMARNFCMDDSQDNTNQIVGTYGYMSPEYVLRGEFSVKQDVYSFGVLVLEIISGRRNNDFYDSDNGEDLLGYAWTLWKDERPLEFANPAIRHSCSSSELMRCLQFGLLCVQYFPEKRPTMAMVAHKLDSRSDNLPVPEKPIFFVKRKPQTTYSNDSRFNYSSSSAMSQSMNNISITEEQAR